MESLRLNGRMAFRRKTACLLIILFSMIATVFLLAYPVFIDNTREELEYAYDSIEVSGWLLNNRSYDDPIIEGTIWHALLDTEYIGTHYTYATYEIKLFDANSIMAKVTEGTSEDALKAAFDILAEEHAKDKTKQYLQALNMVDANDDLLRQVDDIQWLQGYSENCFSDDETICLLPEEFGYQPGDWVPIRLKSRENEMTVSCFQVVGVYPINLIENVCAILPIQALEKLCLAEEWIFAVNGFSFLVKDNRDLPALKDKIISMGLDGSDQTLNIRAAIDDRILEGTISPIKSNLAMLEGLYRFFFAVVAALGFFLCFLLVRGRKPEYAVMRLLGESTAQVTYKALLEQMVLCACGIVLGILILMIVGQESLNLTACGIILVCYTIGAALAVLLTVRVNVMEILRDKE